MKKLYLVGWMIFGLVTQGHAVECDSKVFCSNQANQYKQERDIYPKAFNQGFVAGKQFYMHKEIEDARNLWEVALEEAACLYPEDHRFMSPFFLGFVWGGLCQETDNVDRSICELKHEETLPEAEPMEQNCQLGFEKFNQKYSQAGMDPHELQLMAAVEAGVYADSQAYQNQARRYHSILYQTGFIQAGLCWVSETKEKN